MLYDGNRPLVSVIMPVYNAESYIEKAIESVINQTYTNIELVICDDASTDNTCKIIESYIKGGRIKLIKENENSGSAYRPRYQAYVNSIGKYVLNLDADDYLSFDYIERMVSHISECEADICCGCVVLVNEYGCRLKNERSIPALDFDFSTVMTGREAFLCTVPVWRLSMAGALAKRKIWALGLEYNRKGKRNCIHDDENLSRYMLLSAKRVIFENVEYFYTMNPFSVTHSFSDKTFSFMESKEDLLICIRRRFGEDSKEYQAVEASDYNAFCIVMENMINSLNDVDDDKALKYLHILKKWHKRLNWSIVYRFYGKTKYAIDRSFLVAFFVRVLKARSIKNIKRLYALKSAYNVLGK